ncbi:hypothetical protein EPN42_07290 [bacterium]|nr:MAG: hypothetical protein EPN42_07290 [bacterium]
MIRRLIVVAFITAALAIGAAPALAGWVLVTSKTVTVNITVTPSPIVYVPGTPDHRRTVAAAVAHPAPHPEIFALLRPDLLTPRHVVAQVTQGNIPVTVNVQADPTAKYLHINVNTPSFNAGYGTNTYTCAYQVFAYFPYQWKVDDFVYGSTTSGGGTFPGYNAPTVSDLAWLAEGLTTSFVPFANGGVANAQLAFSGNAGQTETICVDLQLTVPNTVGAGVYNATLEYQLLYY